MDIDCAIYKFKSFWELLGKDGYKLNGVITVNNGDKKHNVRTNFFLKENNYLQYEITFNDLEDFKKNGVSLQYSAYNVHFQDFSFDNGKLTIKCKDGLQLGITDVKLA